MLETAAALRDLGVTVDISVSTQPDVEGFDLVHIFNLQTPNAGLGQARVAHQHRKPVVLSTIFWDLSAARSSSAVLRYSNDRAVRALSALSPTVASNVAHLWSHIAAREHQRMRALLEAADFLLPNSVAELETIVSTFHCPAVRGRARIVPNAAKALDQSAAPSGSTKVILDRLPQRFVLEVARIEPLKGQISLIEALTERSDIPLVFVGQCVPGVYARAFDAARQRRPNTHYVGPIPHEHLFSFYQRAPVHALPSLRESPGLSTLEAGLAGCKCVVAFHAPIQEYFGNDVWVCDPEKSESLRKAVLAAWESPIVPDLATRFRRDFTWARAAAETHAAYRHVLETSVHK